MMSNSCANAIKKRKMLLSEVYVHKNRKIQTSEFEVFHIYELIDDNTQIIPKLTTNFNDLQKVIEALKNSTGSNKPAIQRLIAKFTAMYKNQNHGQTSITGTISTPNNVAANANASLNNRSTNENVIINTSSEHGEPRIKCKAIESLKKTCPTTQKKTLSKNNVIKGARILNENIQTAEDPSQLELIVILNDKLTENTNPTDNSNLITNSNGNDSMIRIEQVFEGINEEFLNNLNNQKQIESANPISKQKSNVKNNEISNIHESLSDFRCNLCLKFNETYTEYKYHMIKAHNYGLICYVCRQGFNTKLQYDEHLVNKKCANTVNSTRPYICIVDPPIINVRNHKLQSLKCRNCGLYLSSHRFYVQHAQRHASHFRCKLCVEKTPMSLNAMRKHLKQHFP